MHFGTDFELRPNISLQQNMISTIGKKRFNLQRLPYMSSNLINLGPETAENGWRVFAHPINFRTGNWETLPALPHGQYNRQQTNFGTFYVVARPDSLEQQNAGWAQAELCHASIYHNLYLIILTCYCTGTVYFPHLLFIIILFVLMLINY